MPVEPHGWAPAMTSEAVLRTRLTEQVGTAAAEEMDAVEVATAAVYGLP